MAVRGQWCLHEMVLTDDLLSHLQSNIDFASLEEKELESNGFTRCIDHPRIPEHVYYEGYFHGLSTTSGAVQSMNPRLGVNMMKPAAPLALRAFIQSFKELNQSWIDSAVRRTFVEIMGCAPQLLCDFAVQIHFGDAIGPENVGWHTDALNSMLHLAVALHGVRALHFKTNQDMVALGDGSDETESKSEDAQQVQVKWQQPGQVYLSSPYAFMHGVEYTKCAWEERIIAIQCRWLLSFEQYVEANKHQNEYVNVMNQITGTLRKSQVILPSLQHVLEMEQRILLQQSSVKKNHSFCVIL